MLLLLVKRIPFPRREHGQTLVEYGLILGLVSLVGLGGLALFADETTTLFAVVETAANCMADVLSGGNCN